MTKLEIGSGNSNRTTKNGSRGPSLRASYELFSEEVFPTLATATQRSYTKAARKLPDSPKSISVTTKRDLERILSPLLPGAHNVTRTFLSRLFEFAIEKEWRTDNPVRSIRPKKLGSISRWPQDRIREALDAIPGQEGLALRLMYGTAQRLSDVERWTPEHLTGAVLKFHQKKTGNLVQLELPEDITLILDDLGRLPGQRYIQVPRHKIYRTWNRVRKELGLVGYVPHGLRKSASCEAAEGGATEAELQALLGHKTARAAIIYRAEADQGILAASAMGKRNMK